MLNLPGAGYRVINVHSIAAGGWYCRVREGHGKAADAKDLHTTGVFATKHEAVAAAHVWIHRQPVKDPTP